MQFEVHDEYDRPVSGTASLKFDYRIQSNCKELNGSNSIQKFN